MKNQRIFPGIILIGFGAYLFLQQFAIPALQIFLTWPTLLIIIGIAFLGQGYSAKDHEAILPGVLFAGFGLHFHFAGHLAIWPTNTIGMLVLFISIGYFLRFQKTNGGLFQAFLFLVLAFLLLFYDKVIGYLDFLQTGMNFITKFWPAIIILIGIYFLFIKKK
ncbi:LiaF transmembrane domain-containing protein [Neobacillus sp. K501]